MKLLLLAGEPSGDELGARLMRALKARAAPDFIGAGGAAMAAEGLKSAFDIRPLAVMGVTDALRAWPLVRRRAREMGELAAREGADAAVLIDSWGLSLRAAHAIRRLSPRTRIIKYVGPQVWATRPGRARTLASAVDHLLTLHPFDAPLFEAAGLPVTFVGNPVLTEPPFAGDARAALGLAENAKVLLLLPGSRPGEVSRLAPVMLEAAGRLRGLHPDLEVLIAPAPGLMEVPGVGVRLISGDEARRAALVAADVAIACSGTITSQLAIAGTAMVVAYRTSALTYLAAKALIRIPRITLINIAANAEVVPEYVQGRCTPATLAVAADRLLNDAEARADQVARQTAALVLLRGNSPDPAAAAAEAVLRLAA